MNFNLFISGFFESPRVEETFSNPRHGIPQASTLAPSAQSSGQDERIKSTVKPPSGIQILGDMDAVPSLQLYLCKISQLNKTVQWIEELRFGLPLQLSPYLHLIWIFNIRTIPLVSRTKKSILRAFFFNIFKMKIKAKFWCKYVSTT